MAEVRRDIHVSVSDLHCGSMFGLLPPSWWNEKTNPAQKWLWGRCWEVLIKKLPEKFGILFLNGDLIDGKQQRSRMTGLVTADLREQTDIAIECIEPLAERAEKIVRLEGTPYHECHDGPLGKLDEHFDIKDPRGIKRLVRDVQLGGGAVLNIKHNPEGQAVLYRGTSLDRETLWATLAEASKKVPHATHLLRAHLHSKGYLIGFDKLIVQQPGMTLQTPHGARRRFYRYQPDIGITILRRDEYAHHGWRIDNLTVNLPVSEPDGYEDL